MLAPNPDEEVVRLCRAIGLPDAKLHASLTAVMVEGKDEYPATLHFQPSTVFEMLKWNLDIKAGWHCWQCLDAGDKDTGHISTGFGR